MLNDMLESLRKGISTDRSRAPRQAEAALGLSLPRRVGLNTVWLGLARIVTQAQLALLTVLAARQLGGAAFGEYALIAAIVAIGNVLTTFGTDTLLIRETARGRAAEAQGDLASAALGLQLALSAAVIAGVALLVEAVKVPNLTPDAHAQAGLVLYTLSLLPLAFFSVYTALLRGFQRMDLYLLANLGVVTLQTIGAWAVLRLTGGLVPFLGWLLVVQAAGAGIAAVFARQAGFRGFALAAFRRADIARAARIAWPLGLIGLLGVVYQRMGVLYVSAMVGGAPVGWFAAAARAVEALKLVHIAVLGALLPALAGLGGAGGPDGRRLFARVFALLLLVSAGAVLALAVGAGALVALLLGPGYAATAPLLQIMSWTMVPYTISACLAVWEITHGREKRLLKVTALATAAALAIYPLLIARSGVVGAAWAAVAVEGVQAGIFILFLLF
jgi:O-antigen/teichoic acid export membrane protein